MTPAAQCHPDPRVADAPATTTEDLARLLASSAGGDDAAYERLYRAVAGPVYRVALRTLRSPAHAEEVAQEVLLEVWRTAAAYRPERGSVLAWVLTIAHRRAVDRVRSARAAAERDLRAALREPVDDEPPDVRVARSLDGLRVRAALERLSGVQRETVVLAYYAGYSQREIADLLDVPLGTVKTRTRDALIRLRAVVGPCDRAAPPPPAARAVPVTPGTPPTAGGRHDPRPRPAHPRAPGARESSHRAARGRGTDVRGQVHPGAGGTPLGTARLDSPAGDRHHGGVLPGVHRGKDRRMVTSTAGGDTGRQGGEPPAASRPPEDVGLPTGGVAQRLGVSPTTIRSWERRYGIGPAHREAGHHRRWNHQDIAVLEAMCRLTARGVPPGEAARAALAERAAAHRGTGPVDPSGEPGTAARGGARSAPGPGPGGSRALRVGAVRPECRGLTRAAVRLDAPEVAGILRESVGTLGVIDAWTEVMMPALRAAGRKWAADGEQYVEVEHLLSWHVSSVLRGVAVDAVTARPVPPVLLAAAPGEQHSLPLEATAAALAERGLPYRMLGAAVPPRALLDAVHRIGPVAVMVWSQDRRTADRELVRRVAASTWGPRGSRGRALVVAAGPGWARTRLTAGTARPRTLRDAVDLLERAVTA
ncbi:sigma-70 family RNA polymerase sigma factor [Kitasatospora sp. NPDC002551]|uniref:sigma-70 family RNA polymerase sigma factor n=1 Tax=Kitasatospora sp. NPDC002551 TaxID=3154539 RepID=UPI00332C08EB